MTAAIAAGVAGFAMPVIADTTTITGRAHVVDGDTIDVGPVRIRIHGIDAPETDQTCLTETGASWACGSEATNALADLVQGHDVSCAALDRDQYGRVIASCRNEGQIDVGSEIVASGLAWAYVTYSSDYVEQEEVARQAALGIWQGEAQPPWEFRANRWERAAANSPRPGCPIKGNINRQGERIYHTPWSSSYNQTVIDEEAGEMWFCDEAEAQAAGWRAPYGR